jgi:hypothetical protein
LLRIASAEYLALLEPAFNSIHRKYKNPFPESVKRGDSPLRLGSENLTGLALALSLGLQFRTDLSPLCDLWPQQIPDRASNVIPALMASRERACTQSVAWATSGHRISLGMNQVHRTDERRALAFRPLRRKNRVELLIFFFSSFRTNSPEGKSRVSDQRSNNRIRGLADPEYGTC